MLCSTCTGIPYDLFTKRSDYVHDSIHQIKASAAVGCQLCTIILHNFELQKRRGIFRIEDHFRPILIANKPELRHHNDSVLRLEYGDDVGDANGEAIAFKILADNQTAYKQKSNEESTWNFLLHTIESWLSDCTKNHTECNERSKSKTGDSDTILPARLIDLGLDGDVQPPRLLATSGLLQAEIRYITLSHRWGQSAEALRMTIKANFEIRHRQILDLPLTFRQAILIAKKVGIRYLWIDSLCILQDDPDDKTKEIAIMGEVYGNAVCNFIASSSENPTEGCFNPGGLKNFTACLLEWPSRDTNTRSVLTLPMRPNWSELTGGSEGGPLIKRGWVLQERYLAKRAVYFSPYFLLWRCPSNRAFEDYPNPNALFETSHLAKSGSKFWGFSMTVDLGDYLYDPLGRETENLVNVYHSWFKIVQEYSSKDFTENKDRICAIAGLAQRFEESTKDVYLAGLWKRDLFRQLCWSVPQSLGRFAVRPESYCAPSWSWLSLIGSVTYPTFDYANRITEPATPTLTDVRTSEAQPFVGPILDGSLKLKGYMTLVNPEPGNFCDPCSGYARYSRQTSRRLPIQDNALGDNYIGLLILDIPFWTWASPGKAFHVLKLWQFIVNSVQVLEDDHQSWNCQLLGLGLELVNGDRLEYKRLGLVYVRPDAESWFEDRGSEVEITIK